MLACTAGQRLFANAHDDALGGPLLRIAAAGVAGSGQVGRDHIVRRDRRIADGQRSAAPCRWRWSRVRKVGCSSPLRRAPSRRPASVPRWSTPHRRSWPGTARWPTTSFGRRRPSGGGRKSPSSAAKPTSQNVSPTVRVVCASHAVECAGPLVVGAHSAFHGPRTPPSSAASPSCVPRSTCRTSIKSVSSTRDTLCVTEEVLGVVLALESRESV